MTAPRRSDRTTLAPGFDMEQYARESDERLRASSLIDPAPDLHADEVSDADAEQVYRARIGDGRQVVTLARSPEEILHLRHGVADGFVLSLVDGRRTVDDLLRDCELPATAALATLFELIETGILTLRRVAPWRGSG